MSLEPNLTAKIIEVDRALDDAGIDHAFGGAIALAYCAEPRATKDIDINVAVEPSQLERVLAALPAGVERTGADPRLVERDGQVRLWWGTVPIDVFFGFHAFHHQLAANAKRVPFADVQIPVIAGADLVVCKAMFDRSRDWADIDAIARDGRTDFGLARRWLVDLLGVDAQQVEHLDAVIEARSATIEHDQVEPPSPPRDRPGPDLGLEL